MKIGQILILSTGEYSDYSWHGPFRVVREFTIREAFERCRNEWTPEHWQDEDDGPDPDDFIGWLSKSGLIEVVDHQEVHVGSYGDLEISDDCMDM